MENKKIIYWAIVLLLGGLMISGGFPYNGVTIWIIGAIILLRKQVKWLLRQIWEAIKRGYTWPPYN